LPWKQDLRGFVLDSASSFGELVGHFAGPFVVKHERGEAEILPIADKIYERDENGGYSNSAQ
jgi:hypothetical protein